MKAIQEKRPENASKLENLKKNYSEQLKTLNNIQKIAIENLLLFYTIK